MGWIPHNNNFTVFGEFNLPIFPHADDFTITGELAAGQIPQQVKSHTEPQTAFDLEKEVAHDGPVLHPLSIHALEVQFAQAPKAALAHVYMAQVVSRRQEN